MHFQQCPVTTLHMVHDVQHARISHRTHDSKLEENVGNTPLDHKQVPY
jgi:hypothetical protein